jgi:hypothetical protein
MPKLTDTQLIILNTAAGRKTRAVLPLPKSLKVNKGTAASVLKSMVAKGLIKEQPAGPRDEPWRKEDTGRGFMLILSEAGLAAMDGGPTTSAPANPRPTKAPNQPAAAPDASMRPRGKVGVILDLVSRSQGAKIAELQQATGWQPHSVRAALTGLRKRGVEVAWTKETDATVYHAKAA